VAVEPCHAAILVQDERSGTDEAHVAGQHVEELRQLVDAAAAKQPSNARDARIGVDLEQPISLVVLPQRLLELLGVLIMLRNLSIWNGSRPARRASGETGPGRRVQLDGDHRDHHQRRCADDRGCGPEQVERPLQSQRGAAQPKRGTPSAPAADVVEDDRAADRRQHARQETYLKARRVRGAHDLERRSCGRLVGVDDDAVDVRRSANLAKLEVIGGDLGGGDLGQQG